jgi:hypothetical protein
MSSLDNHIAEAIANDLEGSVMMTRWIVVAEVIESATGEMSLHTLRDSTTPYWTARGMLDEARLDEEWADLDLDDDD